MRPYDIDFCSSNASTINYIIKILKKTPMQEEDRANLLDAVDTAAGKVVNKMIFGLRDSLNQEAFLECVAGLEKVYEE